MSFSRARHAAQAARRAWIARLAACGAALALLAPATLAAGELTPLEDAKPGLTIAVSADRSRVEVSGLPNAALAALRKSPPDEQRWLKILSLYVDAKSNASTLPMLGKHSVDDGAIAFTPRFPLRPGLAYRAEFHAESIPAATPALSARMEQVLVVSAARPAAPTEVTAVYPSGDELPENLLKFYIHFSAPMARGDAYRHIRLLDADDREIPGAYLRLGEELWSRDGRRFTLLFDPGRIKRGLVPHEEEGMPLVAGRQYSLVIDAGWRDETGAPLATVFRKNFRTTAADEMQPNPQRWQIGPSAAASRTPLVVTFDEPLDRALAQRMIAVRDAAGRDVEGSVTIGSGERRWLFTPSRPWQAGRFALIINGMLEDRAGNSPGRPFEVANASEKVGVTAATEIELPFAIVAAEE